MRYIWCTRYINSLVLLGSPFDDLNLHHALDLDWTVEVRTTQSVTCWLCHKMKIPLSTQSCVISEFCKKNMYDTFDLNVGYLWNDSKSKGYASKNTLHSSGAPFLGAGEDQFLPSVLDFTFFSEKVRPVLLPLNPASFSKWWGGAELPLKAVTQALENDRRLLSQSFSAAFLPHLR